ncbi:MAG: hypothetical protein NZ924_05265 [Candidatus Bipolaricaulota bacterium]|nr:hypothetical protein [Candidatus Bipolaricaulota bacterium]MDW8152298.1 hypothetical protein [Candidatus Bipolaricaulota bacterium]
MRKLAFGFGLSALLALGAFGQALGARGAEPLGRETLVLLWINALELTPDQMKALLRLTEELMPLREEILAMPEKLYEKLLAFTGTPKELRELLAAYQKELQEKLQALEDKFTSGLKKILTVAQWERLRHGIFVEPEPRGRERLPRIIPEPPLRPEPPLLLRLELLRGMALVRLLPTLQEVLTAKLEVLF